MTEVLTWCKKLLPGLFFLGDDDRCPMWQALRTPIRPSGEQK